jgi:hypothetical protein
MSTISAAEYLVNAMYMYKYLSKTDNLHHHKFIINTMKINDLISIQSQSSLYDCRFIIL